jgi:hypothetical protein
MGAVRVATDVAPPPLVRPPSPPGQFQLPSAAAKNAVATNKGLLKVCRICTRPVQPADFCTAGDPDRATGTALVRPLSNQASCYAGVCWQLRFVRLCARCLNILNAAVAGQVLLSVCRIGSVANG